MRRYVRRRRPDPPQAPTVWRATLRTVDPHSRAVCRAAFREPCVPRTIPTIHRSAPAFHDDRAYLSAVVCRTIVVVRSLRGRESGTSPAARDTALKSFAFPAVQICVCNTAGSRCRRDAGESPNSTQGSRVRVGVGNGSQRRGLQAGGRLDAGPGAHRERCRPAAAVLGAESWGREIAPAEAACDQRDLRRLAACGDGLRRPPDPLTTMAQPLSLP